MFWAHNLDNLKQFVEQEHAREMSEISGKASQKVTSKEKQIYGGIYEAR